ncbi:unnamed protein product [Mesocestoides corti]|uniref:Transposase n=1 Tax=Mesocestoides corti TaxID=53468 RepID=A0A0R3U7R1_MESCO|nr:unnamed protein product [Mesocestoides corti]
MNVEPRKVAARWGVEHGTTDLPQPTCPEKAKREALTLVSSHSEVNGQRDFDLVREEEEDRRLQGFNR